MRLDRLKLIQLRAKRKWRQIDAASKCGVSIPAYRRAEEGTDIDDLTAGKIAVGYKADLADLVAAEEKQSA